MCCACGLKPVFPCLCVPRDLACLRDLACVLCRLLSGAVQLFVLGGFDGYKWLSDLNVLDVGKLEETAITTQVCSRPPSTSPASLTFSGLRWPGRGLGNGNVRVACRGAPSMLSTAAVLCLVPCCAVRHQAVTSLLDDLRSLVNNRDSFPDIVFMVEGREVFAHKALLCCRSRHFRAMFNSGACADPVVGSLGAMQCCAEVLWAVPCCCCASSEPRCAAHCFVCVGGGLF